MLTDQELIVEFVQHSLNRRQVLLSNSILRAETVFDSNQMIAKNEGIILKTNLTSITRDFLLKGTSSYFSLMNEVLANYSFILSGEIDNLGFYSFQYFQIPKGYQIMCTKTVVLWQMWWKYKKHIRGRAIPLELLIRYRGSWYPIRDLIISQGFIYITTLGDELSLSQEDQVTWLRRQKASSHN
ncbi:MAG: hypothetical protein QNJ51_17860 [Calothrix sp. MO_167.B12]|nr:hypothetical protein [Calothrix sp. MO_167.B12]